MMDYYIIDGKTPIATNDINEYANFMGKFAKRIVEQTELPNDVRVSTVFIILSCGYKDGLPLLFETKIFGGKYDEHVERYTTWEQAQAGHKMVLDMIFADHLIFNNKQ